MEYLRKSIFWLVDYIKGSPIKKNFFQIGQINTGLDLNKLKDYQKNKINSIINYAKENVEFYNQHDCSNHINLPIIDKKFIRDNYHKFKSENVNIKDVREVVTSGSTGLPFKVLQDNQKVLRNTADTMYFGSLAKYKLGQPLAYIKIWNNINSKSPLLQRLQNIIPINVINLSEEAIEQNLILLAQYREPICMLGYSSAIEKIANYINKNKINISFTVSSVITMSEGLDAIGKSEIEQAFKTKVFSRYSNVENGIIAQQTDKSFDYYFINSASYYVEILEMDLDVPVLNGQLGRIVITDFFNRAMPMLRYDTGDIGIKDIVKIEGCQFEVLSKIEGRKMDAIYNTRGNLVSSFIITNGMWNYSELLQYQFIQKGIKSYQFKLNVENEFDRENELIEDFKRYLGEDACIEIVYVNEIPLLSSGKRKKVINIMKNS